MNKEPVAIVNTVVALIEAVILAVVAFGVQMSSEQIGAVMGAVIAAGAVVQTFVARSRVFSPATHDEVIVNVVQGKVDGRV